MKLPIPFDLDGNEVTEFEVREATAETLASTNRELDSGATYGAMLEWCAGSLKELSGPDVTLSDLASFKRALKVMPFESAWAVATFGMARTRGSDLIEGSYSCPKCKREVIIEGDGAERLSEIQYSVAEGYEVSIDLETPVEIVRKDTGAVAESVESLTVSYPTLGHCMRAQQRYPDDDSRMMLSIYADCVQKVNGKQVDRSWRVQYGDPVLLKMTARDVNRLSSALKASSLSVKVERVCMKCKSRWMADLNLSGFFASGLGG